MSFVRRKEERTKTVKEGAQGGSGKLISLKILDTDGELMGKGRLFNVGTLEKGDEVGWHIHKGDGECYLMLSGEAQYSDNGKMTTIYPGDVTMVYPGEGHSIKNLKDEPVVFIALILYE